MRRKRKVKSNLVALSQELSPQERAGRAIALAAQALMVAADALLGRAYNGAPLPAPQLGDSRCTTTVIELVNEFLLAKARAGRSDRYLRQLRVSLSNFRGGRSRVVVDQVKAAEIEEWIHSQDWAAKTQRGYLSDVRTLFNFARNRGYVERNPAAGVELPVLDSESKIQVHTPEQVKKILQTVRRANLDACRILAVRYFAGVRSAEAHRLTERDLKLEHGLLEVPAVKSKTRARRLVTIQPNLRAWLELGGELRPIGDQNLRNLIRLAKVDWPHNVTRHSFVSYHLAKFGSAAKTALEAGHTEGMLFAHYRAIVTPGEAEKFWEIRPA